MAPEICAHCGGKVPVKAKVCPHCGSDETTGWSKETNVGELGIPEEEFAYNEFINHEFGTSLKPRGVSWIWWITAALLALLFIYFCMRGH
ncbi:MAG: hypothetical protein WCS94_17220 [Verrucomicrobiota bacterium]